MAPEHPNNVSASSRKIVSVIITDLGAPLAKDNPQDELSCPMRHQRDQKQNASQAAAEMLIAREKLPDRCRNNRSYRHGIQEAGEQFAALLLIRAGAFRLSRHTGR